MRFFFFALVLLGIAGGALWWVSAQPWAPPVLQARQPSVEVNTESVRTQVESVDRTLANIVRDAADGKFVASQTLWNNGVQQVQSASISAQFETSPKELWQTLREEGAQAVLKDVAQQTAVSVNGVSTEMITEARYQYCVGVVQQYEQTRSQ